MKNKSLTLSRLSTSFVKGAILIFACYIGQTMGQNTNTPIDLVADSGSYDQAKGMAIYEGNVEVNQGNARLVADKLTIILKDNTAERLIAESTGKKLVQFKFAGDKQPIEGEGKKAVYQVAEKIVTLTGDAKVVQGDDVVTGNKLTYDLKKEVIKGSRIRMIFLPNEK